MRKHLGQEGIVVVGGGTVVGGMIFVLVICEATDWLLVSL